MAPAWSSSPAHILALLQVRSVNLARLARGALDQGEDPLQLHPFAAVFPRASRSIKQTLRCTVAWLLLPKDRAVGADARSHQLEAWRRGRSQPVGARAWSYQGLSHAAVLERPAQRQATPTPPERVELYRSACCEDLPRASRWRTCSADREFIGGGLARAHLQRASDPLRLRLKAQCAPAPHPLEPGGSRCCGSSADLRVPRAARAAQAALALGPQHCI
ncbi:MAG: hypothetical protein MZV65_22240 [Chromatiales bacterium]|nr:hypothetical protein [Chromatiales bacterium]